MEYRVYEWPPVLSCIVYINLFSVYLSNKILNTLFQLCQLDTRSVMVTTASLLWKT